MQTEALQSGRDSADGLMWVVPFLHEKNSGLASYAPMVRQGDDQWFQVVREVEFQLIHAAANDLMQATAKTYLEESPDADADVAYLGLSPSWQMKVIAAGGNHAEILVRNFGEGADTGVNAVWSRGGLHWALP
jgi:general L-amino acid transport system substrate-binding protein